MTLDLWGEAARAARGGYDPRDFYVSSQDSDRQRGTTQMRVPPWVESAVAEVVQGKDFPYKTSHEFWRDAGVHRLYFLREHVKDPELRKEMDSLLRRVTMEEEAARRARYVEWWEKWQRDMQDTILACRQLDDFQDAHAYLDHQQQGINQEREPFRSRGLELVAKMRSGLPPRMGIQGVVDGG